MSDATRVDLEHDLASLTAAAERATRREVSSVGLTGAVRPTLREALSRGVLDHAYLLLEHEGEHPCVAVRPRAERRGPTTVTGILEDDHRRLDAIADRIRSSCGREPQQVVEWTSDFAYGLRRHIRIEEELLFPIFESQSGMGNRGPTQVMRMEHRAIVEVLDRLEQGAAAHAREEAGGWDQVFASLREIEDVLVPHNVKEERILYPLIDEALRAGSTEVIHRLVLWE